MLLHAAFAIPLLPLLGFLVLLVAGKRLGNPLAGWVGVSAIGLSFVAAVVTFAGLLARHPAHRSFTQTYFTWVPVGRLHVSAALLVDPLSLTMALFVTAVSALIHLYSIGYMEHDGQFSKFFVYLNLFVFSMVMLVMANNLLLTFLGWEGVGVCSYWLIAFWFDRDTAASAGKKAFIYNRLGDVGFLIAMFFAFAATGTLNYGGLFSAAAHGHLSSTTATAITLLLFMGAVGKSAQIPLFPWLLDAMEGPTPVSALIHAATMVTAGVYLMCRVSPLLQLAPAASTVIAIVGVATAFVAAAAACAQSDIKRVLAYSTVSQLGYMFLAVGSRAYVAAIFLMVAHAFYKALLFLGAGSVIHGLHDEQDLRRMGGLRRLMPITAVTFLVAWVAIGGIPPFSGFWAKGSVLDGAYDKGIGLYVVGAVTTILTVYYIGREVFLVFYGPERWREVTGAAHWEAGQEPRESRRVMLGPLVILAVLSIAGGVADLPFRAGFSFLDRWLDPVFGAAVRVPSGHLVLVLAIVDGALAVIGGLIAIAVWNRPPWLRPELEPDFLYRGWYVDTVYDRQLARPATAFSSFLAYVVDDRIIDGAVMGLAQLVRGGGRQLRRLQTGYVRNYALAVAAGAVILLAYVVARVR
ncbi:MAG: NADH-quinone oxidoreductase subunit L [Acidimicrobiales bacterium]|nr:NADH-quinone oxidoreductase subunit L [Acidimicrobiales bacterium]MBO0893674.1 NADH-quinone oxidoreductase subunit L [Acidimicrobiales bacterium]